jgi:hypothetical protein
VGGNDLTKMEENGVKGELVSVEESLDYSLTIASTSCLQTTREEPVLSCTDLANTSTRSRRQDYLV